MPGPLKLLIVVEGGVVQSVITDAVDLDIRIVDHDEPQPAALPFAARIVTSVEIDREIAEAGAPEETGALEP
jgi:hypothetical protein